MLHFILSKHTWIYHVITQQWLISWLYIYIVVGIQNVTLYIKWTVPEELPSFTGRTRRETCRSTCKLYSKTWSTTQAGSKHQQTGITQARQRVILGQVWVFNRPTISRGLEKRSSPITWAIVQTVSEWDKGQYKIHRKESGDRKQGNTKWLDHLEQETRLSKAAITRWVINAEQY